MRPLNVVLLLAALWAMAVSGHQDASAPAVPRAEAMPQPTAERASMAVSAAQVCRTLTLNDSSHNIVLKFTLTNPLMTAYGLPVYVAPNPFPSKSQYPVLLMYFNKNLGGKWGWCVTTVATPVDGPYVYYLAYGNVATPYAPTNAQGGVPNWVTGVMYPGDVAGKSVTPGVICTECKVVTLDDRNHGIVLNFAMTNPLMIYSGMPVYSVANPFADSNTTSPLLLMYFNKDVTGDGAHVGWSVAAVSAPVSSPYVYYLAVGAFPTPYDPSISKNWVTGVIYTPGGAQQPVYAVGCTGFSTAETPLHALNAAPSKAVARATIGLPQKACSALTEEKIRGIIGAADDVTISLSCPNLVLHCAGSAARADRTCGDLAQEILRSDSAIRRALLSAAFNATP